MSEPIVIIYDTNSDTQYWFGARTSYEAMTKMLYTLNVSTLDKNATIQLTPNGLLLTHRGREYWTRRT